VPRTAAAEVFESAQNFTVVAILKSNFIQQLWCLRRYTFHLPSEEKENLHHITKMPETTCFVLQVMIPSSLSTDRNHTDVAT